MRSVLVATVLGLAILVTASSALGAGGEKERCGSSTVHGYHVSSLNTAGGIGCHLAHQHVVTYLGGPRHLAGYYCNAHPGSGHTTVDCTGHAGYHSFTFVYHH